MFSDGFLVTTVGAVMNQTTVNTYRNVEEALGNTKSSFFVFNSSEIRNPETGKGNLYIMMGEDITVFIPPTWIPIDLLQFGTIEDIRNSPTLRAYQRSGLITLLTEEGGNQLMKNENYEAERQRVLSIVSRKNAINFQQPATVTINTGSVSNVFNNLSANDELRNQENMQQAPVITPDIESLFKAQEIALSMANMAGLKTLIGQLFPKMNRSDYEAIISNSKNSSSVLALAAQDALDMVNDNKTVDVNKLPVFMEMTNG